MAPRAIYEDGFRVSIYLNDHEPPHVHVRRYDADLRVYLDPWREAEPCYGRMSAADERRAIRLVAKYRTTLLEIWRRLHP